MALHGHAAVKKEQAGAKGKSGSSRKASMIRKISGKGKKG